MPISSRIGNVRTPAHTQAGNSYCNSPGDFQFSPPKLMIWIAAVTSIQIGKCVCLQHQHTLGQKSKTMFKNITFLSVQKKTCIQDPKVIINQFFSVAEVVEVSKYFLSFWPNLQQLLRDSVFLLNTRLSSGSNVSFLLKRPGG